MISPLLCSKSRDVRNGSSCNFGWLESEPKSFESWSRSLIFELPFNRRSLWSKPIVQTIQWLVNNTNVFNGPSHSRAGAKHFQMGGAGAGTRNLSSGSTALGKSDCLRKSIDNE